MKIIGYRIEMRGGRSLSDLIAAIEQIDIAQRNQFSAQDGLRLEQVSRHHHILMLDFARPRAGHGPGRMSPDNALSPIDLGADEEFGEDTACAVDTRTGNAAFQYNHFGPRASAIERYLHNADAALPGRNGPDHGVDIGIVLRRDTERRLNRLRLVKSIEAKIAVPGHDRQDRVDGAGLGAILDQPLPEGMETLRFSMSSGRGVLDLQSARQFIDMLRGRADLESAIVEGSADENSTRERIDLIDEQLQAESTLEIGRGRRYGRDNKWVALRSQLTDWNERGDFG